jgi:cytoskeletal protein RodZ
MERTGERLRRRREELGLTLEDVSEAIRFRPEVIQAVEEGRTNVFPAEAYLSAFLRAYAVILELDPREIVREQKSEEERAFEAIRNIRIKPKRRKFPRRVLYIAIPVVLAAVLLLVVDRFLWDRGAGDAGRAETPVVPGAVVRETAPADTGSPGGGAADTAARDSILPTGGEAERPEDAGAEGSPAEPAAGEPAEGAREESSAGTGPDVEGASPAETGHRLVVSPRRSAYINLVSGDSTYYDGYLGGGQTRTFFSDSLFTIVELTDRDAWTFLQDGERVQLPGSSGEDVSDFAIPPASDD